MEIQGITQEEEKGINFSGELGVGGGVIGESQVRSW